MPNKIFVIIRKVIVVGLALASYGLWIWLIGWEGKILESLLASIAVFLSTLYLAHETQYYEGYVTRSLITLCTLNLIGGIILGQSWWRFVGMIIAHAGIYNYHSTVIDELVNRIRISGYRVCTSGVGSWSLTVTAAFSVFFVATYSSFAVTCEQLRSQSDQIISSISLKQQRNVLEDFVISSKINQTIGSFFQTSVGDIVQGTSAVSPQPTTSNLNQTNVDLSTLTSASTSIQENNIIADTTRINPETKKEPIIIKNEIDPNSLESNGGREITHNAAPTTDNATSKIATLGYGTIKDTSKTIKKFVSSAPVLHTSAPTATGKTNNQLRQGSIVSTIDHLKYELVDKTVSDTKLVDQKVCDFIVQLIGEKYSQPGYKISVVVLLWLLLVPFIRIIVWIIAFINRIVYLIINRIGIYRIVSSWIETQEMI